MSEIGVDVDDADNQVVFYFAHDRAPDMDMLGNGCLDPLRQHLGRNWQTGALGV